ncbi:protein mono-ADP-ribosyltransferase PARP10 isoform X2 [Oryctolagus cuniculus]|uniref:protein mono-ADP-ribosyltransferase PARP10 isoform X2 n=1 Tax=Oryctolagus cuniculus TaxID=9986 RepID=UPI003879015D
MTGLQPARVVMEEVGAEAAVELQGLPPDVPDQLLLLYFENRRRSGGGPVLSWRRLGCGGILTFQELADAERVLAQTEHELLGAQLSLRPAPPRAPARLLLQGLPPDTAPLRVEQHVQALLRAVGHPVQPCRALASPRPDRALVQLPRPLSEAVAVLEQQAQHLDLDGASVSLAPVPQARAVRVVGDTPPEDQLLLQLYLENERHSGGGPLEGLRRLPGPLGTVISFQQWQVAERVLQRDHWLQGSKLDLVPHYDVLEPEQLAEDASTGDRPSVPGPGATEPAPLEAGELAGDWNGAEPAAAGSGRAPGQSEASLRAGSVGSPGPENPVETGMGLPGQEGVVETVLPAEPAAAGSGRAPGQSEASLRAGSVGSPGPENPVETGVGLPGQEGVVETVLPAEPAAAGSGRAPGQSEASLRAGSVGSPGPENPVETGVGLPGQEGVVETVLPVEPAAAGSGRAPGQSEASLRAGSVGSPGPENPVETGVGLPGQEGVVETVLPAEPGAVRFLQLYHEELLASLGEVALFPLEETDVTGFRLCGALAPCQAAEEFLQSLLGTVSCHVLCLRHPGSTRFLLGPEGRRLLQQLEAQFQCVLGTERLAGAAQHLDPEEVDPTEALQILPGQVHTPAPQDRTGSDQNENLEEVQELLATLESLDREEWLPLEMGEEEPEEKEPVAPSAGVPGRLEEEAALQLALCRSLEPQGQLVGQEEAAALQRALAISLLEAEEPCGSGTDGRAQLVVHVAFDQDVEELGLALEAALEAQLREETVGLWGRVLPVELCARVEKRHDVSVALCSDYAVLRGFGAQPARAARHLAALLAGPFPLVAAEPTLPDEGLQGPLGRLEGLAESTREFQDVVRAFYDTLDAAHSRIHIIRVERVWNPLLQRQYELQRERLEQRCARRPAERVLYHGTSASAVRDICAHGFNRSFCGRNGTLYGQGVYFAQHASLSVQDRYSPPDADGHKAVFVARVLTGDYGLGHSSLRAPPPRASGHTLLRYDSAVDCLRQPSIFVIFHDTQALPTHLITCRRASPASPGAPLGLLDSSPAT